MNKTLKYTCLLLLMLVITGNQAMAMAAANDEETDEMAMRLLEQTIQKKMSLQDNVNSLNQQIKNWNETIKSLDKKYQDAYKKLKKQQPQLEKIQPDKYQKEEAELVNRQQELQTELEQLKDENARLQQEIQTLDEKSQNLEELEGIKQDVAKDFVNENESYLETPFSKMEINKLKSLQKNCENYKGNDKVKEFSNKLNKMINLKETYDSTNAVVNQPFDKQAIINAQRALETLGKLNHLSESQMNEVETLRHQLDGFEAGLIAFKEFINHFAIKRKGITTAKDVDSDVELILEKVNAEGKTMQWRIDNEINVIPYLKEMFAKYRKAIKASPKKVSDVENAILEQYNNIKQ